MAFCSTPKVRMTRLKGRLEASRARARQLVVELRVLELREVQGERLLEDHDVDALAELRAQQRLCEGYAALAPARWRPRDSASRPTNLTTSRERRRAGPAVQVGRVDHRVDDQRAHEGDSGRQYAREQREHGQRDAQALVRRPDQFEGAAAVGEDLQKAAFWAAAVRRFRGDVRMRGHAGLPDRAQAGDEHRGARRGRGGAADGDRPTRGRTSMEGISAGLAVTWIGQMRSLTAATGASRRGV